MQEKVSFFTAGRNVTQMFAEIVGLDNKFHIFDVDISLTLGRLHCIYGLFPYL